MIYKQTGAQVGVDTTAYSAGDLVGGLMTLTNTDPIGGMPPYLSSITLQDLTKQNAALTVIVFDANPSGTTFTNNAALDIADADLPKVIAVIPVAASDYASFSDNSAATVFGLGGIAFNAAAGSTIYAALLAVGTPTYGANELSISFGFVQ